MFPAWPPAENAAMQQIAALQHVIQTLQTQLQFAQSLSWPQQQEIQRLTDELQSKDEQIKNLHRQLEETKADSRSLKKDLDALKADVLKLRKKVDIRSPPQQNSQTSQRQQSQNKSQYLQVPGQQTNSKPRPQLNDYQPQQKHGHIQHQQPSEQHQQQSGQQSDRSSSHNTSYSDRQQRKQSGNGYNHNEAFDSNRQQPPNQHSAEQNDHSSVRGYGNSNASNSIRHDSAVPRKQVNTQSSVCAQGRAGSGRYPYDSAMPTDYGQHDPDNGTHNSSIMPYGYTRPSIRANTETSTASSRPKTLDQRKQPPKLSSKKHTGRLQLDGQFSMSRFEEEIRRLSFDTDTRAVTGSVRDTDSKGPIRELEDDPFVDSPPNRVAGYGGEPGSISLSPVPLPPGMMSLEETMQMIESEEKKKAEDTLVKYETRDDRLVTTAVEIDRICQMIARWSASFCSKNGDIDLQLQGVTTTDVSRLALVVESLAPLPPNEAKKYALELLRSKYTSQLLASIVWRFLQQRMMQPDILTGLLPNTFEKVVLNQQQLMQTRDTDTSPEERARMITERGDAVNEILQHREFIAFRVSKVKEVITELRPIVKPFFGAKGVKTAAALELNDIGMKVFNLLINTLTESGVFVTKWANIRQGYVPSAMRAPFNREPPSSLWGKRVQLSIFPSIIFRDDSAGNIYTKMTNSAVVVLGKGDLPGVFAVKQ